MKRTLILAGILCLLVSFVYAQTDTGAVTAQPAVTATPDEATVMIGEAPAQAPGTAAQTAGALGFWDFFRMLLVLLLVVAAMYGIFYLVKKGRKKDPFTSELMKQLGSQSIGGTRTLHLVEVGRHVFLLGSTEQAVNLIAEITDQESVDELKLRAAEESDKAPRSFADLLGSVFSPPQGAKSNFQSPLDYLKEKKEKIKKLGGEE